MVQMENMETSLINWANRFEQACKQNSLVKEHEIYIEAYQSDHFLCQIDRRGRWNGRPIQTSSTTFEFSCTIILQNGQQARKQYSSQLQQSPQQIVEELIQGAGNHALTITGRQKYHHLSLEIWDPRYPRMNMDHRVELFEWNISTLRGINKNVRIKRYELTEEEHFRLYHSSKNATRLEKYTVYYFKGELYDALTEEIFTPCLSSHRFADISSQILGLSYFEKRGNLPAYTKPVEDDFLLILPARIVANIIELLYPAFDLEKIETNESFLSGKQGERIGSERVHLLDNGLLPSGYHSRSFDASGYPPRILTLINEGIFQDCYVRKTIGQQSPTGHLDFEERLWPGNLLIHNGRRSQNMVLAERSKALLASELAAPIQLDIKTGQLHIAANYHVISSNGIEGDLGVKEIDCHIINLLQLVLETTNDQNRSTFIDSSSWVLENCSLFLGEMI